MIRHGSIGFDTDNRTIHNLENGKYSGVTRQQGEIFALLLEHHGKMYSREDIALFLYGDRVRPTHWWTSIAVQIYHLRNTTLRCDLGKVILTRQGNGWFILPQVLGDRQ